MFMSHSILARSSIVSIVWHSMFLRCLSMSIGLCNHECLSHQCSFLSILLMNALHRFYLPACLPYAFLLVIQLNCLSSVQLLLNDPACFLSLYMDPSLLQAVIDQILSVSCTK